MLRYFCNLTWIHICPGVYLVSKVMCISIVNRILFAIGKQSPLFTAFYYIARQCLQLRLDIAIEKYLAVVNAPYAMFWRARINNSRGQITAGFVRDNASCIACSRFFCMHFSRVIRYAASAVDVVGTIAAAYVARRRPFSLYSSRIVRNHLRFITVPFSGNFVFHRRWQPTTTWIQSALTDDEFLDRGDRICISPRFHARGKNSALEWSKVIFHQELLGYIICRKYIVNIYFFFVNQNLILLWKLKLTFTLWFCLKLGIHLIFSTFYYKQNKLLRRNFVLHKCTQSYRLNIPGKFVISTRDKIVI